MTRRSKSKILITMELFRTISIDTQNILWFTKTEWGDEVQKYDIDALNYLWAKTHATIGAFKILSKSDLFKEAKA